MSRARDSECGAETAHAWGGATAADDDDNGGHGDDNFLIVLFIVAACWFLFTKCVQWS